MNLITFINEYILWGLPALLLFMAVGLMFTFKGGFRQFRILQIFKETVFHSRKDDCQSLSPFQSLTSALAMTLGTGNIVALGMAIAVGGAGAVFWMWVSAAIGMATSYAENVLGAKYRRKDKDGSFFAGAFLYIEKALGKPTGVFYALCCLLAAFGMGNMTQMSAMAHALNGAFGTPTWLSGITAAIIVGLLIYGGTKFFGQVTEKVIPLLSFLYIAGCLLVIIANITQLPAVMARIVTEAFDISSVTGGILGSAMFRGMAWGVRKGVFSNEAGLGSSVAFNSLSCEESPARVGRWAMLAVFIDTIVMCTLTAFAILLAGADVPFSDGSNYAAGALGSVFGEYAGGFLSIAIALYALATTAGYAVLTKTCIRYLPFMQKCLPLLMILYILCCAFGAIVDVEIVWQSADMFNGVMAVPNLLALIVLRREVMTDE
jgi:AGCS family alanine or glycine:cation symporter